MLPVPMVITAIGITKIGEVVIRKFQIANSKLQILLIGIYLVFLGNFVGNYLMDYLTRYRVDYSWAWQYGYKEVVSFIKEHYSEYDKIIISKKYGEPHEFVLFYWPWPPQKFQNDPTLIRFYKSDWYWVDRFDKFYFINDWDIPKTEIASWRLESGEKVIIEGAVLLITSPGNYPQNWRLLKTIYFLDGKPAFDIVEKKSS